MAKINDNTDWASYATAPPPVMTQGTKEIRDRLSEDARKFSENPMDESIRHPHPHGMDDFIKRSHPDTDKKSQLPESKPESAVPTTNKSNTTPPSGPANSPSLSKPSNPLVPKSFYCWEAGKLGFIDLYCKFDFTELK